MATFKVTTQKCGIQPAGLTKTFVQAYAPSLGQLREWLKAEYNLQSPAGMSNFTIEKL